MLKKRSRKQTVLALAMIALLLKVFTLNASWVEDGYTYGVYPFVSRLLRVFTGWLPFSLGDIVYFLAGFGLIYFLSKSIRAIRKNGFRNTGVLILYQLIRIVLLVYIFFNCLWGLNYYRQGIAHQLSLQVQPYNLTDVVQLTQAVQAKLNLYAAQEDTLKRMQLNTNQQLFQKAILVYDTAGTTFKFLKYKNPSIKASIYSSIGQYFGFTGYYNPFSGEAQIKTDVPVFLKPFVATHEIAHQLGYAKENEANFVAFLASKQSHDVDFLYSLYYDLYSYSVREVYSRDTTIAMRFKKSLHPQVRRDNEILKAYFIKTENPVEPIITRFYDQYLKWNNQKSGVQTYNEVVALLISYGKKFGWEAI